MDNLKQIRATTNAWPLISSYIIMCDVEGKRTAWEAKTLPKALVKAMLGSDDVYIVQCGIEAHPKRFEHHSIIATKQAMDSLAIEELNSTVSEGGITDLSIFGKCLIGPSWCFALLEDSEVADGSDSDNV